MAIGDMLHRYQDDVGHIARREQRVLDMSDTLNETANSSQLARFADSARASTILTLVRAIHEWLPCNK